MTSIGLTAAVILVFALFGPQSFAADGPDDCLSRDQRRAAVASKQAISLSAAIRAAHGRRGELVKARLCRGPEGLVYLLTLLARDGKVTRATVDAATGRLAEGR